MHPLTGVADARLSWSAGAAPGRGTLAPPCRPACGGAAAQPLPKAPDHHRSSAAPMPKAPGHIRPGAAPMPKAPGHIRPCAASMPMAPGHIRPPRRVHAQGVGPRPTPAPRPWRRQATLTLAVARRAPGRRVPLTIAPVPAHASRLLQVVLLRVAATPRTLTDPLSHATTHQVHPAIQVPTRPPPATAGTGGPRQRHSRAPPPPVRHPPSLPGRGPGGRSARLPSPGACSGGGEGATSPPRSCADAPRATRRLY